MTDTVLLCLCTCPDAPSAGTLARSLVEENLAACVSQLPGATSTYYWQGQVQTEAEVLLLIKTSASCYLALETRLRELHPYELPELLALPVTQGLAAYLDWVRAAVRPPGPTRLSP